MIMPGPGRRQDQISGIHVGSFTVYSRVGPFSLDDESKVDWVWRWQAISPEGSTAAGTGNPQFWLPKIGIFKNQDPPLGFLALMISPDLVKRAYLPVPPKMRNSPGDRLPCQQLVDDFPKRSQFMTVDSLVEFFKVRTRGVLTQFDFEVPHD